MSHPSPTLDRTGHSWLSPWIALDAALALGWAVLAWWIVPPLLVAEAPGPLIGALQKAFSATPLPYLSQGPLGPWRDFSGAVLIALVLHLTIVVILDRFDRSASEGSPGDRQARGRMSLMLGFLAAAFLAVTIRSAVFQDYFFFIQMWYEVRVGHDPWFLVVSRDGQTPLNGYGPLFNLLTVPYAINPFAPKLLFAYAYIAFAIATIKRFLAGRPASWLGTLGLIALFWNPFPWVEIAVCGHFDILVGLACLGAVRSAAAGREVRSGVYLAAGVLLKYLPITLLPFLALDRGRGRSRLRLLAVATVLIAAGLGLSALIWGPSTFRPLTHAATRSSTSLSIFGFLRGRYSPLYGFEIARDLDSLATVIQLLALGWVWSWARRCRPDVESSAVVAAVITVMLYRVGFPQYQMVPFVLGASWATHQWDCLRHRAAAVAALAAYVGWLAVFDPYYILSCVSPVEFYWGRVSDLVGLPPFLIGCALVAAVVRAEIPVTPPADSGNPSCSDV